MARARTHSPERQGLEQQGLSPAGVALDAEALAARLPRLMVAARHTASIVGQGVHGRRRAGQGEHFFEFRRYEPGEPVGRIDWRRSARQRQLYVREREWESLHTIYVGCDLSPSMHFRSSLASDTKAWRAAHLAMALSALSLQAGEKVAALGVGRRYAGKAALEPLARDILAEGELGVGDTRLKPFSDFVLISDFLMEQPALDRLFERARVNRARLILMHIIDPAETVFPYSGHTRFEDPETGERLRFGEAGELKADYQALFEDFRARLRLQAVRNGGVYLVHHTDASPAGALLSLFQAVADPGGEVMR